MSPSARLPAFIWGLAAALVAVYLVLQLADSADAAYPSAGSYSPSGSRAYAELLRRLGYRVEVSRSRHPKLGPDDIAVMYQLYSGDSIFQSSPRTQVEEKLKAYGAKKALVLYLDEDFRRSSMRAREGTAVASGVGDTEIRLSIGRQRSFWDQSFELWPDENAPQAGAETDTALFLLPGRLRAFAIESRSDGRAAIHVADGLGSTNRFLDKEQNAAFFAGLLRYFGPERGRVVFLEASIDNAADESLLAMVAPWSGPARFQAWLIAALAVWALGKRFGLPEARRFRQSGAKELVDAVADTAMRARATDFALAQILDDCERRLRNALKVGRDASRQDLLKLLPAEVADPFARCAAAVGQKAPESEAVKLAARLQEAVDRHVGRHQRAQSKRKPKT